jgi:hypothetical protein
MRISTERIARRLAAATLATTLCAGPGAAMTFCLYEDYRGTKTKAGAISIMGTGFQLDLDKAQVRRIYGDAATVWYPVTLRKNDAFVSAAHETYEDGSGGRHYQFRWSFRVHTDGDCELIARAKLHEPITAKGRVQR